MSIETLHGSTDLVSTHFGHSLDITDITDVTYSDKPNTGENTSLTVSTNEPTVTDITDVTYFPKSNNEFLRGIFFGIAEPHRPFVLGFAGKPKDRKAWGGEAWRTGKVNADNPARNWYFSLAVYAPADDGFHRRGKDCVSIYGVMLDDLGTKALPLERLDACSPSYVIETSEGNFQAGYLFSEPQTDFESIAGLNQSMVEAGLCDPGAKSPTTRYGRLPFASNGKSEPAFECRLVEWHPDRRYTVKEIIDGLELTPPEAKTRKARKGIGAGVGRMFDDGDNIHIPRQSENEVITALKQRNLYKQPLGGGKHDVTCPWVHEHTDGIDHGAAYFEPTDLYPIGGFKCQHSHGDKYRTGALIKFLDVSFIAAKHKPTIKIEAGEIHRIVDAAERELAATKRYYQRGGLLVSVQTDPETRETQIKQVSQPALLRALAGAAIWMRFDGRSQMDVVSDPPARHVNVLFDAEAYAHLPAVTGIARQPHLRPDGVLVRQAGFDATTGLFGVFNERLFDVPDNPTHQQAKGALAKIIALLSEFEFVDEHDRAAALAGILTAAIRPSLEQAPMFHVKAPMPGSGKSYLTSIIAAFASPTPASADAFPTTEEECEKLLLATLLTAPAAIVFDNLTSDLLPFKSLCSVLTEPFKSGRILGISKMATVGTRTLFLSSGNNVDPVKDMTRRCLTIAIQPQTEQPANREYKHTPHALIRANREYYVSLAITVVRAYLAAGSPVTKVPALNGYDHWGVWVRQPLLWLGVPDPAKRIFDQLKHDPDRETLGRLLAAWHGIFKNDAVMVRKVCEKADALDQADLKELLFDIAELKGQISNGKLGKWIARHQGRIVDGLRFERGSGTTSAEQWAAKSVRSVKSVSVSPFDESGKENFRPQMDSLAVEVSV